VATAAWVSPRDGDDEDGARARQPVGVPIGFMRARVHKTTSGAARLDQWEKRAASLAADRWAHAKGYFQF
jgi:hypothetical protein